MSADAQRVATADGDSTKKRIHESIARLETWPSFSIRMATDAVEYLIKPPNIKELLVPSPLPSPPRASLTPSAQLATSQLRVKGI